MAAIFTKQLTRPRRLSQQKMEVYQKCSPTMTTLYSCFRSFRFTANIFSSGTSWGVLKPFIANQGPVSRTLPKLSGAISGYYISYVSKKQRRFQE